MIVVADTSVILNLCRVQHEHLLLSLFGRVLVPTEVAFEFSRLAGVAARFGGFKLPDWVEVLRAPPPPTAVLAANLDAGEAAAIALCVGRKQKSECGNWKSPKRWTLRQGFAFRIFCRMMALEAHTPRGRRIQAKKWGQKNAVVGTPEIVAIHQPGVPSWRSRSCPFRRRVWKKRRPSLTAFFATVLKEEVLLAAEN